MEKKGDFSDWTWHNCWCHAGLSECFRNDWSAGIFPHRVGRKWSEKLKISSEQRFSGWKYLVDVREEWPDRDSNNHSLQTRCAEEHLWMHNMLNLEADGLQQQKTRLCHCCQLRTGNTGSPKLDSTRLENVSMRSFTFCHHIWMVGLELHESMGPPVSLVQAAGAAVMVCGILSCYTLGFLQQHNMPRHEDQIMSNWFL